MIEKPYSPSCERNRAPILAVLRDHLADRRQVLEIGSGTGQHAAYFAAEFPHLTWQTSDVAANLPGIRLWLDEAGCANTPPPLVFDVNQPPPAMRFDTIYTANTLHIMSWREVERLFALLPDLTEAGATLVIYGPFSIDGAFTSDSNARFDAQLRQDHPLRGIRDRADVLRLAAGAGFSLIEDRAMPANNRTLVCQRTA